LQNSFSADSENHEQEKVINQLRMRVAVLEQELKDKEQVLSKSSDLLGAEQDKKVSFVQSLFSGPLGAWIICCFGLKIVFR